MAITSVPRSALISWAAFFSGSAKGAAFHTVGYAVAAAGIGGELRSAVLCEMVTASRRSAASGPVAPAQAVASD